MFIHTHINKYITQDHDTQINSRQILEIHTFYIAPYFKNQLNQLETILIKAKQPIRNNIRFTL